MSDFLDILIAMGMWAAMVSLVMLSVRPTEVT